MKSITLTAALAVATLAASTARAQNSTPYSTIYTFQNNPDAAEPRVGMILGHDGKLYGTSYYGGTAYKGTVFTVTNAGAVTVLHSFDNATGDGSSPYGELVQGSDGRFYGTTVQGGDPTYGSGRSGEGTVYAITAAGAETVLYRFNGAALGTGSFPYGGLVEGPDGKLYGTTSSGGTYSNGTIFSVTKDGVLTTLHHFNYASGGPGSEGEIPRTNLVLAPDGKMYGTTLTGGTNNRGTVFSITTAGVYATVFTFGGDNDYALYPNGLILGRDGKLYGTSEAGGTNGQGTVFSITTAGEYRTVHSFVYNDDGHAGVIPKARLAQASDGRFYGTTFGGGVEIYDGTAFSITADGIFHELHRFNNAAGEGRNHETGLVQGSDGNLYGTCENGGAGGAESGVVFRLGLDLATGVSSSTFFNNEAPVGNGVRYLSFSTGNPFGYYSYLSDPRYIYHFDLGYEYIFDAADGKSGVYLYDFLSGSYFYTSPTFPFPYLYDFSLNTTLYYYPDPANPGRYNTNGVRYFYNFATGKIITK